MAFYVDFHQNSHSDNFDVATLGISLKEAQAIQSAYREIRDRVLRNLDGLPKVNLVMEPVDKVTFGARVAKVQGILRMANRSLHVEMPAHRVLHNPKARHAYTEILTALINRITTFGPDPTVVRAATPPLNGTAESISRSFVRCQSS